MSTDTKTKTQRQRLPLLKNAVTYLHLHVIYFYLSITFRKLLYCLLLGSGNSGLFVIFFLPFPWSAFLCCKENTHSFFFHELPLSGVCFTIPLATVEKNWRKLEVGDVCGWVAVTGNSEWRYEWPATWLILQDTSYEMPNLHCFIILFVFCFFNLHLADRNTVTI